MDLSKNHYYLFFICLVFAAIGMQVINHFSCYGKGRNRICLNINPPQEKNEDNNCINKDRKLFLD